MPPQTNIDELECFWNYRETP